MNLKGKFSKFLGVITATVMGVTMLPQVSLTSFAASPGDKLSVGNGTSQHKGVSDGYSYEIWIDSTGGSGSMTLGNGGAFKAEWSANVSRGNFLARRGKDYGSTTKATQVGNIVLDYAADYRQTGSASGNSRLCVYGWFQNKGAAGNVPLVEYYIIEDWVDWVPDAQGKMVTIDGAQYKIFQMDHTGPTINGGSETFKQYYSVRQQKRKSGTITVSDHFKAWESQGWGIGNLYEVALNAEGWQSSGVADITKLVISDKVPTTTTGATTTTAPIVTQAPTSTTANPSALFFDTFESGVSGWAARGDCSAAVASNFGQNSKSSIYVTSRTQSWHGATATKTQLKAGGTYNLSAQMAYNNSTYSSQEFVFGVQYDDGGTITYQNVDSQTTSSGKWVELSGEISIPSSATNISLYAHTKYVETPSAEDLIDFYVDNVEAVQVGSVSTQTTTTQGGSVSTQPVTTTQGGSYSNPKEYMAAAKANFTPNVPADVKTGDKGKLTKISYYSKKAQKNKPANVWLPPNYSESGSYPVVYMNHGIMGGEDDMTSGWGIREMASNLIEKGEVKPFIIVFTQMYTDPKADRPSGITPEATERYDDFLYDLTESLMPYMSEHYAVAEGRENTAIAGFSMGGRESIYIGMKACDKIGYVCASSPAPGIIATQDSFMVHKGNMTESQFKFSEPYIPYLLMIGGGTADSVVGTYPKQYHELFDKNGTDNIWFEVQGGGHDASVGTPLFYNFFRNLFKAGDSGSSGTTTTTTTTTKATTITTVTTLPIIVYGDLSGDGRVTNVDLVTISQHLVGDIQLSGANLQSADVTNDGKVDVADLALMKQFIMGDYVVLGKR